MAAMSFRFRPPLVATRPPVDRPRLLAALAERFDRRVTTITAGPGFGKTALLVAALDENELHPRGVDVWLQCRRADAEAVELGRGLLGAFGRAGEPTVAAIADAVWSRAPDDVVIVLDDAHEIAPGSSGERLVADLVGALPRNGHLLVSGRRALTMPTARLRLSDDVTELGEADLAFDDEEVERFAASRAVEPELLGAVRWPAVAELVVVAGHDAATEYLWDEVLGQLDPSVVEAVARLQPFGEIDDELAAAVTGTPQPAAELLGDLPLTERTNDGALRLHALWEPTLRRRLDPDARREALRCGAAVLLGRGEVRRAFEASTAADDFDGQRAAVRSAVTKPLLETRLDDLHFLADRLPAAPELDVERVLLRAVLSLGGLEATALERFEEAAELARGRGDNESESLALWRLHQSELWAGNPDHTSSLLARLEQLAVQGNARAQILVEVEAALEVGRIGNRDEALRRLRAIEHRSETDLLAQTANLRAAALLALGCPEEVLPPDVGASDPPPGSRAETGGALAHAVWLRGDVSPEVALALGTDAMHDVASSRIIHQQVGLLGVLGHIAAHAGQLATAAELVDRGQSLVQEDGFGRAAVILQVANATLAVARHDEARARSVLEATLSTTPIRTMPFAPYQTVLPMLHLLIPSTRAAIEGSRFGPAFTVVQEAARALTALRERGEPELAAGLPWQRINLLRAHVAPPYLAELAIGALTAGAPLAEPVLDQIPDRRAQLQWVGSVHSGAVAELARERLAAFPIRPAHVLRFDLLGSPTLYRDDVAVTDGAWKRERVRQILGFLLSHPMTTRREMTTSLWPGLDEHDAGGNLRTNLTHLQRVLQPDRPRDEAPWFVRSDGELLSLCTDGLETDVQRFDALIEDGRRYEDRGVPGTALARYLAAIELYRGDYFAGLDDSWVAYERIRLRSSFVTAATRAGELLLARGEPEQALRLADRVAGVDELAERAHRLRVHCLLALGDRSAARTSGQQLLRVLAQADLAPERETTRLLASLGLTA